MLKRALFAAITLSGCLWTHFDETVVNAPVEFLDRPSWVLGGYGTVLSANPDREVLLAGGYPLLSSAGLLSFPNGIFTNHRSCDDPALCRLVSTPIPVIDHAGGTDCFLYGIGGGHPNLGTEVGIVGGCASGALFKLPLPENLQGFFTNALFKVGMTAPVAPEVLTLASSGTFIAAGSPDFSAVYIYQSDAISAEIKPPAGAEASFAQSLAFSSAEGPPLLAIGAPAQGKIFIYNPSDPSAPIACLRRAPAYGAVLHGFSDHGRRLLAISDASTRVDVVDLDKLQKSEDCIDVPDIQLVDSMQCLEDSLVKNCQSSAFGTAIISADLNSDGSQELIIGAPGLKVRDVSGAGAIAIFPIDPTNNQPRYLFLSSATAEERVGTAVAAFRKDGRLVVASSALNKQKTPIFHCASTTPSERCK